MSWSCQVRLDVLKVVEINTFLRTTAAYKRHLKPERIAFVLDKRLELWVALRYRLTLPTVSAKPRDGSRNATSLNINSRTRTVCNDLPS